MVCVQQAEDLAQRLAEECGFGSLENSLVWAFSLSFSNIVQAHDTRRLRNEFSSDSAAKLSWIRVVKNLHAIF